MKKFNFIYIIAFVLSLGFIACENEYEDKSQVTSVPELQLIGDNPMIVIKGAEFVDPGIAAVEFVGNDTVDMTYEVLGMINPNLPGSYKVSYKVVNSEGVAFYLARTVSIVDLTGFDVFELPVGDFDGKRVNRDAGGVVSVAKITTGIYSCSDLLGGYYELYAGYGPAYGAPGVFVIDEEGNVRSELGYVSGWDDEVVFSNFKFDSSTNTISYAVLMVGADFGFDVVLTLK